METLSLVARILLAVVFFVAGSAKLFDLRGSQQALKEFGIPRIFAIPFGILLPLAEIVIACLLLPDISAWLASICAFLLLLIFFMFISFTLAQGKRPQCHCFGQLSTKSIGSTTLLRNSLLVIITGLIILQGPTKIGPSMINWIATLTYAQLAFALITLLFLGTVYVQGWLLLHLLKQHGRLLIRLEDLEKRLVASEETQSLVQADMAQSSGLPVGLIAPSFQLRDIHDEIVSLRALQHAERPVILIFVDPDCGPCLTLMPEISHWQHEYADQVTIALISRGSMTTNCLKGSEYGIMHLLVQQDFEVAQTYRVQYTPSAVIVRPNGTIGSPLVTGADTIRKLVGDTLAASDSRMVIASARALA